MKNLREIVKEKILILDGAIKTADYVTDKQAIRQRAEKCSRTQKKTKGQGQVDSLPFRFPSITTRG